MARPSLNKKLVDSWMPPIIQAHLTMANLMKKDADYYNRLAQRIEMANRAAEAGI